jgi:hypothetical protein
MEDITNEVQCAIDPTEQLNIRAFGVGKKVLTNDPRSIHMLKSGLMVYVVKMSSQEIKISDDVKYFKWLDKEKAPLPKFGFNEGRYLWVCPQIYHAFGKDQTMAKLIKRIMQKV